MNVFARAETGLLVADFDMDNHVMENVLTTAGKVACVSSHLELCWDRGMNWVTVWFWGWRCARHAYYGLDYCSCLVPPSLG